MVVFTSTMKKHPLYVLPKDTLAPGMPQEHLYMSNNHAFKHKGRWQHMKCSDLTKKVALEELEYFHIIVEDYFNTTIVAENVEVETCFKYKEDNVLLAWSCKKTCCQPLKIVRELNKVQATKITLPECDALEIEPVQANTNNMIGMIKKIETMKLSQDNVRNIQKFMDRPFDPLQDTYQLKKNVSMGAAKATATATTNAMVKLMEKDKVTVGSRQQPFMQRSKANPEANANLLKKVNALLSKKM